MTTLLKLFRILYFLFQDTFCLCLPRRVRIHTDYLLLRTDGIGDFVLWLSSASYLLSTKPRSTSLLICPQSVYELALQTGLFDYIIPVDYTKYISNIFYRFSVSRHIRSFSANTTLNFTYSRTFITGDSIVRIANSQQSIGFCGDFANTSSWESLVSNNWYSRLINITSTAANEVTRNTEFIRALLDQPGLPLINPSLPLVSADISQFNLPYQFILLFPGASTYKRQWPIQKFCELSRELYLTYGYTIVICGGKEDSLIASQLEKSLGFYCINLVGATTLTQFCEIVKHATLVVTNETSAVHIAASSSVPTVCIQGGGHYSRYLPFPPELDIRHPLLAVHKMPCFQCDWNCTISHPPTNPWPCIDRIEVSDVFIQIQSLLNPNNE